MYIHLCKHIPQRDIQYRLKQYIGKLDILIGFNEAFPYNYLIWTGRGVQIVYIYNRAISSKLEIMHKRIQDLIIRQHEQISDDFPDIGIKVDSASTRKKSGVYRMPGTYHSKTHTLTILETTNFPYLDNSKIIDTYGFFDEPPRTKEFYTIPKKYSGPPPQCAINRAKHSYKIINAVKQYQEDRTAEKMHPGHENRNCSCFVLAHFLLEVMDYDAAMAELQAFNNRFNVPLPQRRLQYMLDYAYSNYLDDSKARMRHLRNTTVLDYLNLEEGDYGIDDATKRNKEIIEARRKRVEARKKEWDAKTELIIKCYHDGFNNAEIANEVGCSIKTVQRKIKANIPEKDRKLAWERLGISKSEFYRQLKYK